MRGDEIAGGKDVADENPRLDFTLPDDVFSSGPPYSHLSAGLTLPSRFQSAPAGLGPGGNETCLPSDRERAGRSGRPGQTRTADLTLIRRTL